MTLTELQNATDKVKLLYVKKNPDIILYLDNDDTFFIYPGYENNENEEGVISLTNYLGDKDGVFLLLDMLGIYAEGV